jgi:hypothetical protein
MSNTRLLLGFALLALCVALYFFASRNRLNVEPHAAKEIEKAKER